MLRCTFKKFFSNLQNEFSIFGYTVNTFHGIVIVIHLYYEGLIQLKTKKPIAWVTDSTFYLSNKLKKHPDLYVIPLNIHFGEKQFADGIDLTSAQLYEEIRNAEEFPKTSQPSAGEFAAHFEKLAEEYEQAIAIHLSSKLSGTFASSKAGAELTDFPVTFIDSLSLSHGTTALIEKGMELFEQGMVVEEIKEQLEQIAGTVNNYILIGKLDQLYKGGRMNGVQFFLGSLLKIKPIIQLSETGKLEAIDKVRSEKKAMQYLVDKVLTGYRNGAQKVYVIHGNIPLEAVKLQQHIQEQAPGMEIEIGEISSVLAVHGGEGTLAVLWVD